MQSTKYLLLIVLILSLSGCLAVKSTITTRYPDGRVVVEELSDDALYYKQAASVINADSAGSCVDCSAEGKVAIEAFKTIRAVTGKQFVERGMNGVEGSVAVGKAFISQTPLGLAVWGLKEANENAGDINMGGDGATYVDSENHWTGNDLNDGNTFTTPLEYDGSSSTAEPFVSEPIIVE